MFSAFGIVSLASATKVQLFVDHLRQGRLMASRCGDCGQLSFPPRADCPSCMSGRFEFTPLSGRARVHSYTTVVAAPSGFEGSAPYTIGLVDLEEGGRAIGWFGASVPKEAIAIGMEVRVVPRTAGQEGADRVFYSLEIRGPEGVSG